jgi:type I restriction enzyme S subunit
MKFRTSRAGWTDRLPQHWGEARMRFVAAINPSKSELAHVNPDTEVSFLPMESVGEDGAVDLTRTKTIAEVSSGYTYFRDHDLLVAKITPCFENGKAAQATGLKSGIGFGSTEFHVLRARHGLDARFLLHLLRSPIFRDFGAASMYGAAGQKRVPTEFIADFVVPLPPICQQAFIAAFLDREMTKVENLIAKQNFLLASLDMRRHSLAADVFQQFPPSSFVRLKFLCDILPGYAFSSEQFERNEGGIRLLRGINVAPGRIDWSEFVSLTPEALMEFDRFQLKLDDIVIGMDRPWIGSGLRIALVRDRDIPSLLVQRVARLRCRSELIPAYAEICLRSPQFLAHFEPDMTGVSVPHISDRQIGDFKIPVPTIGEQEGIVAKVGAQLTKVAALEELIETSIEIMRERRAALITSAITGQLEIPPVAIEQAA